jgi:hypothetical protein
VCVGEGGAGALPPTLEDAEGSDGGTKSHPSEAEHSRSTSMEDRAATKGPPAAY